MDRGTWQATVYGVSRVGHDYATKHSTAQVFRTKLKNHLRVLPPVHLTSSIIQSKYIGQMTS